MKPLLLLVLSLLTTSICWANPIVNKDWMVNQGQDEVFAKDACLAATNKVVGTQRAQLLLSFTKDRLNVPQLLVKVWDNPTPEPQLLIKVSAKVSYPLFLWKASTNVEEPSIYWYAPIGWSPLVDYIAAAMDLNIQGTNTQLKVSLRGSSASISAISTCLKANEILPMDFLKKINAKSDLNVGTYASVDEMIAGVEKNFETYRNGLVKTKELATLRKGSAKLLAQETEATEILTAAQKRWQTATDNLNVQLQTELQHQQTLATAKADLQRQQTELPIAQADAQKKKATYDPIRKQLEAFLADVDARQTVLNKNIREARNLQARISDLESEIPALRNERDRLNKRISDMQYDVDRAKREFNDADSEADRYNEDSEFRSKLWRTNYDSLKRDADRARNEASRLDREVDSIRSRQRSVEQDLQNCNNTPGQDCSSFRNELSQLDGRAREMDARRSDMLRESQNKESQADSIERSVRSEVQNEKRRLESIADDMERKYRSLSSEQDSAIYRRNQIDNALPDLRAELNSARARLPQVQAQRPALEQQLAEAQNRLQQARVALDYDRIEKEHLESAALVVTLQKGIATSQTTIAATEKKLKNIKPVIVDLTKERDSRTVKRDQAAAKLAPIQEALKPFRAEEAVINQAIATLAKDFEENKARYQRTYEGWITPVPTWSLQPTTIGTF